MPRVAPVATNLRPVGAGVGGRAEYILRQSNVPFDCRPDIPGEPDIIIPGKAEYDNPAFPTDRLFMLGVKTTCKDRWRQVLNEAERIPHKHLVTLQEGISKKQLLQMEDAHVTLIVPRRLHSRYPIGNGIQLMDVEGFLRVVKHRLLV